MSAMCCCTTTPCSPQTITITATMVGCSSAAAPNLPVTVTGPSGYSASCTTNSSGQCSVTWTVTGTYTVSATIGSQTQTATVHATSCTGYTATLGFTGTTFSKFCITIGNLCDGTHFPDSQVTVSLIQGGVTVSSGHPTSSVYCAWVPSGVLTTVHTVVSRSRWDSPGDQSATGTACGSVSLTANPTVPAGYSCNSDCPDPYLQTLNATLACTSTTISGGSTSWISGCLFVANTHICSACICTLAGNVAFSVGLDIDTSSGSPRWRGSIQYNAFNGGGGGCNSWETQGSCSGSLGCSSTRDTYFDMGPVDCTYPLTVTGTIPANDPVTGCPVPCPGTVVFSE